MARHARVLLLKILIARAVLKYVRIFNTLSRKQLSPIF